MWGWGLGVVIINLVVLYYNLTFYTTCSILTKKKVIFKGYIIKFASEKEIQTQHWGREANIRTCLEILANI